MAIRCILINPRYTLTWLSSQYDDFQSLKLGIAIPGISRDDVNARCFPLPPLAEQKRIVGKVNRLMTLCDNLEAKLVQAQQDADNLLAAIVQELVSSQGSTGKTCR